MPHHDHFSPSPTHEHTAETPEALGEQRAAEYHNISASLEAMGYATPDEAAQQVTTERIAEQAASDARQVRTSNIPELSDARGAFSRAIAEHRTANLEQAGIPTSESGGILDAPGQAGHEVSSTARESYSTLKLAELYALEVTQPENANRHYEKEITTTWVTAEGDASPADDSRKRDLVLAGLGIDETSLSGLQPEEWQYSESDDGVRARTTRIATDIPGVFVKITQSKSASGEATTWSLSAGNPNAKPGMFGQDTSEMFDEEEEIEEEEEA